MFLNLLIVICYYELLSRVEIRLDLRDLRLPYLPTELIGLVVSEVRLAGIEGFRLLSPC